MKRPFSNWLKISDLLSKHSQLLYQFESLQDADIMKFTNDNPESQIHVIIDSSGQLRMNEYGYIPRQIVFAILFLSKQDITLERKKMLLLSLVRILETL